MAKLPRPFKYRGKWRATVTLKNGQRPTKEFNTERDANEWITDQLANANAEHEAQLGGPTQATLAKALQHYAMLYTIRKGGAVAELTRISHYLERADMQPIKLVKSDDGSKQIVSFTRKAGPVAWQKHTDERRAARQKTYGHIKVLANKRCSAISTADLRKLMAYMQAEGLSDSTIQKEIALLKHVFNVAADEWSWKGFKNPCLGIKLGKSKIRFVFIAKAQREALWQALSECDNSYYLPLVIVTQLTTLRKGSLLAMTWDQVDLEGRVAMVPSKTGDTLVPLSRTVIEILHGLPRHESGRVFPMSANAIDMAWDGVRQKAELPTLQFRDLRHIGATDYARRGINSHQLKDILGHKTTYMSDIYVNLVQQDILDALDKVEANGPVASLPPPIRGSVAQTLSSKRAQRLAMATNRKNVTSTADGNAPNAFPDVIPDVIPDVGSSSTFDAHAPKNHNGKVAYPDFKKQVA